MANAGSIEYDIEIPDGITASLDGGLLTLKGKKDTLSRDFTHPKIQISLNGKIVHLGVELPRKKEKALIGTYNAHINNMIKGLTEGFEYHLKIVYSHFPMKVSVKGDDVVIENFEGEKSPRKSRIMPGCKVSVKGDMVIVTGADKEAVGQTAANIERATRIKGFDIRVFQDGIYITEKL